MSKFFVGDEVNRITFPDGEWVDVKEEMTQADQDYILNHMARGENLSGKATFSMTLGRMAMLERGIVAWSFTENGVPVPVNKENISCLRNKYRSRVLETINSLAENAGTFISKNV
ncbi:MAG: hypothetical protein ABW041_07055 [Dehalococcoides mccartyi]